MGLQKKKSAIPPVNGEQHLNLKTRFHSNTSLQELQEWINFGFDYSQIMLLVQYVLIGRTFRKG